MYRSGCDPEPGYLVIMVYTLLSSFHIFKSALYRKNCIGICLVLSSSFTADLIRLGRYTLSEAWSGVNCADLMAAIFMTKYR